MAPEYPHYPPTPPRLPPINPLPPHITPPSSSFHMGDRRTKIRMLMMSGMMKVGSDGIRVMTMTRGSKSYSSTSVSFSSPY